MKNLGEYWWILPVLLYFVLLAVVMRRGMWATVGQNIYWVATCVLVLLIPTKPSPSSYVLAVLVVLNLWIYRWSLRKGTFVLERASNNVGPMTHQTSESDEV
jgi:predicted ABC-type exoprotein transport system permease subunit